jgi:hypothetical protein
MLATLLMLSLTQGPDSGRAYPGRDRAIAVQIPRLEQTVVVDGALDDAAWASAARLTGFSQYQPVDSRPAEEETEVLVWYGPTAIYFGIRAREAHGDVVRATRADRDNIGADDHIQILLDTYHDRRLAYLFGVNPFGVQQDGIRSDQFGGGAGGFSAGGRSFSGSILDGNVDLNPDFVFESRGRLVPGGYDVEIRIPFKSLRYQGLARETWGINVLRRVQHTGYQDSWAPVVRASASFLGQSGRLEGLHDLHRGLVAEVTPTATGSTTGAPDTAGRYDYRGVAEFGLTGRLGLTPNLTLDGTINPDFSQVEADIGQVAINERFELFYPEKRPFFLEGLELFDTPNQLIYTRRIVNPDVGAKLAGKVGATSVALLAAADDDALSWAGATPLYGALRLRRDIGRNSTAGLIGTLREDGGAYSRLLGGDLRIVHSRLYFVEVQAVQSWSDSGGRRSSGPLLEATWDRTGRSWGFNYRLTGAAPDFNAAVGFVNRTGIVQGSAFNRLTWYGRRGALVETVTGFFGLQRTFDYASFLARDAIEGGESATFSATLRGGWNLAPSFGRNFVSFDPAMYAGYGVFTGIFPSCCAPFTVPPPLRGLVGASLRVTTPTFRRFTASASATAGEAAIFPEATEGRSLSLTGSVDWRPAGQVRVSAELARRTITRARDDSRFSSEAIPRLKVEYQATRAIFLRLVSQYAARRRDALYDRNGAPIYINGQRSDVAVSNDLRMDWLFSYRPSPGTLVYLGYGSSLAESDAFAFGSDLRKVQDGFFGKVSWLFRM